MFKWQKYFQGLVIVIMMLGAVGPAAMPAIANPARMRPMLARIAAETPEQMVSVIVQRVEVSERVERLVTRLGGRVTKDLHIINAFAAEMTASAARQLATSSAVRWISLDGAVASAGKGGGGKSSGSSEPLPENYYLDTLGVRQVWDMGYKGEGIVVAVIDSGVTYDRDFTITPKKPHTRIKEVLSFNTNSWKVDDATGHGTHVAGILGGNGSASDGAYAGIAPGVDLISLKVSDEAGMASESDVVVAMQWVYDNMDDYDIRVVNLSLNSTVEGSYHTSPMNAAAEILWFNGVVVVASAGNKGPGGGFNTANAAPANDPFIITVGAGDERGTIYPADDTIASFSAFGTTIDGISKPDIIAPGKDIISVLADSSDWGLEYPDRVVLGVEYFRLSGTSMAAPMVTGAVALLLQAEPDLTPDQVKYRLMNTSMSISGGSYGYLDVYAAVTGSTTESANTGLLASQMLWSGDEPVAWDSVAWNSVAWNSVAWNSVAWNSVAWNSVAWNSVAWTH